MKNNILLSPPNLRSNIISVFSVLSFLGALYGGGYGFSIDKRKISAKNFTVSQSLAFGNKYLMISLFSVAFLGIIYLNYLRGPKKLLIIRILFLILIFSFMVSIMWVTTYENSKLHYGLAGTIFTSDLIYIAILTFLYQKYLKKIKEVLATYILDLNLMFAFSVLVLLITFGIFIEDDKTNIEEEIFASNENIMVLLTIVPIVYLGFI